MKVFVYVLTALAVVIGMFMLASQINSCARRGGVMIKAMTLTGYACSADIRMGAGQ